MNVTVYLPDEIGQKAKAVDLNFSRLLRNAIEDEMQKIATAEKHLREESTEIDLPLYDEDGNDYVGTFEGRKLGEVGIEAYYMKDDGDVVVYNADKMDYVTFDGIDDPALEEHLQTFPEGPSEEREDRVRLMNRLNIKPRIAI